MRFMLSYQHAYHAGNQADVHKHALLATILVYLTQKDKPITYIETHAGRGLYNLQSAEAVKTGESTAGIRAALQNGDYAADHPYRRAVDMTMVRHGGFAYPGSPLIAKNLLRDCDRIHIAEKHPQEYAALRAAVSGKNIRHYHADGYDTALALSPPPARRGIVMIDPSYEVKAEYKQVTDFIAKLHRKWNVAMIALWYPLLESGFYQDMTDDIEAAGYPDLFKHEVLFNMDNPDHRLKGSGMLVINAPYILTS